MKVNHGSYEKGNTFFSSACEYSSGTSWESPISYYRMMGVSFETGYSDEEEGTDS